MKSIFVVSEYAINRHAGEEYDSIIEVVDQPTTENIHPFADRIRYQIRSFWAEQISDTEIADKRVVVYLDAASPFADILINLQTILKAKEGIEISLPWDKPIPVQELDSESRELLAKLGHK